MLEPLDVCPAGGVARPQALANTLARAGQCLASDYLLPGVDLGSGGGE